jgi:hypothetical protein
MPDSFPKRCPAILIAVLYSAGDVNAPAELFGFRTKT